MGTVARQRAVSTSGGASTRPRRTKASTERETPVSRSRICRRGALAAVSMRSCTAANSLRISIGVAVLGGAPFRGGTSG